MPIVNGQYVSPTWQNGGPPALEEIELQAITDTLENLDAEGQAPTYTAGNGISILNDQISSRMSSQSGNSATFGSDGGIYVPESSYTLPVATTNSLGGIKVGSGLSITGDGLLSASGGGSVPSYEFSVSGNFDGQTSVNVGALTGREIFGRPFVAAYAYVSNRGQASPSTMGCTFGGYPVLPSLSVGTTNSQRSTVALYYKAYQQNPGYYVVGVDGFYGLSFNFTSSTGQGSYALHVVGFGPSIDNT